MEFWRRMQWAVDQWNAVQVDLNGQYSLDRFAHFHAYSQQRSWAAVVLRCVVTPLPCILFLLLLDSLPLEPTTTPSMQSPVNWLRGYIFTLALTVAVLTQAGSHLPALDLSTRFTLLLSLLASTLGVASAMLWTSVIGHPLPFSMLLAAPPWAATLLLSIYLRVRTKLRATPSLKKDLIAYVLFSQVRLSLTIIYPAYVYVFASLSSFAQTAFVLVLPLIKLTAKNLMGRALRDHDDLKPEALIFIVEVFHALFVSYSMQNATSIGTALVLMASDALHAWVSIMDVNRLVAELRVLSDAATRAASAPSGQQKKEQLTAHDLRIVELAQTILHRDARVRSHPTIRPTTFIMAGTAKNLLAQGLPKAARLSFGLVPSPSTQSNSRRVVPVLANAISVGQKKKKPTLSTSTASTPETVQLVRKTLQLLYVTEFIVLVEFVEIVVPIIFSAYMMAMFHLPNRAYYPLLKSMSDDKLALAVRNVIIYSFLEVVSFIAMSGLLWWRVRVSALHQLAFVLEKHWVVIQWGLVTTVAYVVQTSLQHCGFDYSFRFEWLRHNAT